MLKEKQVFIRNIDNPKVYSIETQFMRDNFGPYLLMEFPFEKDQGPLVNDPYHEGGELVPLGSSPFWSPVVRTSNDAEDGEVRGFIYYTNVQLNQMNTRIKTGIFDKNGQELNLSDEVTIVAKVNQIRPNQSDNVVIKFMVDQTTYIIPCRSNTLSSVVQSLQDNFVQVPVVEPVQSAPEPFTQKEKEDFNKSLEDFGEDSKDELNERLILAEKLKKKLAEIK